MHSTISVMVSCSTLNPTCKTLFRGPIKTSAYHFIQEFHPVSLRDILPNRGVFTMHYVQYSVVKGLFQLDEIQ